jgi:hypothetical protein
MLDERPHSSTDTSGDQEPMATKRKRLVMTDEHKEALAIGRRQGIAVRRYLEALEQSRPRRGRRPNAESAREQLDLIETRLAEADPLERLHLLQQRRRLVSRLETTEEPLDIEALEDAFIDSAAEYASRKGIDYATWREVGVPAEVLRRAGIARTRS